MIIGETISHYRILEKLGAGGMGEVYKAEDTKLKRTVALKFLPREITRDPEAKKRFIQEAQAASTLEHSNICSIYEIEETEDNRMFIAMPCCTGGSLEKKIRRGPMSVAEAVDIAIQVGQGLAKAHEKGITHRDIKPANILLTDDKIIKIVDFGLAKLAGQTTITADDKRVGTPVYMSPEQAKGKEVDPRTDIWSFGVVLYEMLTGQLPFEGENKLSVLSLIVNEKPKSVKELNSLVPRELERIIKKILEKEAGDRYQQVEDLIEALRRLKRDSDRDLQVRDTKSEIFGINLAVFFAGKRKYLTGAAVFLAVIVIAAAVLMLIRGHDKIDSLAILPFVNTGGQENTEYLSDRIPESLISSLQKIPNLKVISFNSVLYRYKNKIPDARIVEKELDVRAVAMGRMTLRGEDITINIEIVDTKDNSVILSGEYFEKFENLIGIRTKIARDISDKLRGRLTGEEEKKVFTPNTTNPDAEMNYLLGRYHWNKRTEAGIRQSIDYFKKAIESDATFALAYSGLADAYTVLPGYSDVPLDTLLPDAIDAAQKALKIDRAPAEAYASYAVILMQEYNWEKSLRMFEKAIEINPNYATAHHWYGVNAGICGEYTKAIASLQKAVELDPLSLVINRNMGLVYMWARQYDNAVAQLKKTLAIVPDDFFSNFFIASVYKACEQYESYIHHVQEYIAIAGVTDTIEIFDKYFAKEGINKTSLRNYMTHILRIVETSENPLLNRLVGKALLYNRIGDRDAAFAMLNKAAGMHDPLCLLSIRNPEFDNLRIDTRFVELLRTLNLDKYYSAVRKADTEN
ncbi:protein kinase [Acidobacteriota bacterium]